jgi:hypothetical protein
MPILGIMASSTPAAGDYESIATTTLGSSQATITFSSIPATYKHLQIRGIFNSATAPQALLRFNSDSAGNYSYHQIEGNGVSATAGAGTSVTSIIHFINGMESGTTAGSAFVVDILDYANTNKYKTTRALTGTEKNGSGQIFLVSGSWRNTNAVTDISVTTSSGTFAQYTQVALYGIK